MVRYEKILGPIHVAWGYDRSLRGYFLAVVDTRLQWEEDQSEEVNEICAKVAQDGGGSYFDLNTYSYGGFGYRVSRETIFTFMRRYGIDPDKINNVTEAERCRSLACRKTEPCTLRCSNCMMAWYCSKECQKADWKEHKEECREVTKTKPA